MSASAPSRLLGGEGLPQAQVSSAFHPKMEGGGGKVDTRDSPNQGTQGDQTILLAAWPLGAGKVAAGTCFSLWEEQQ